MDFFLQFPPRKSNTQQKKEQQTKQPKKGLGLEGRNFWIFASWDVPYRFKFHLKSKVAVGIAYLNYCSTAKMSFALCCMLFGILAVCPETGESYLTYLD